MFFAKYRFRMIFAVRKNGAPGASTTLQTLVIFDFWHRRLWPQRPPPYTIWRKSVTLRENKNEAEREKNYPDFTMGEKLKGWMRVKADRLPSDAKRPMSGNRGTCRRCR